MNTRVFTTIPKKITGREELVVLPRSIFDRLISVNIRKEEALRWSREAKELKSKGKLPVLKSLRDLR